MLIEDINLSKKGGQIVLSASVQFRGQLPEIMYFATDAKNASYVANNANPFFAAILLPCMKTGEDIFINGSISQELLNHSKKIMSLVSDWNIGLQKTNIYTKGFTKTKFHIGKKQKTVRRASFFSAGVDSFYTYLKHKDEITDFILVHGFDIPLENKSFFKTVKTTVNKIAAKENVRALFVETNAGEIIEKKLIWDFAHGGALAAVGLFLGKQLNTIYIAGAVKKADLFPYGTHPALDKLWSTKTTSFVHDGTEQNRIGKIITSIAKSELALENIRVCTQNFKGKYNCSRCFKCLSTMMMLICADAQNDAKTFTWPIDLKAVKNMYYDYNLMYNQQGEANLNMLRKLGRETGLQNAIAYSLEKSKKPQLTRIISKHIAEWDQKSNDRRLYQFIFKMNKAQDRNLLFKLFHQYGIIK